MISIRSHFSCSVAASFLLSACLRFGSCTAQAGLLDSDGFVYGTGTVVGQSGGTGWTGAWANPTASQTPGAPWGLQTVTMGNRKGDASVVTPGLSYSGLTTSGSALNAGNLSAYRPWDASSLFTAPGQSLWVSFLVNPISGAASQTMYVLPFAQNNSTVGANYQYGTGVKFNTLATSWNATIDIPGQQNGSGYTTPTPVNVPLNQNDLIVMEFNYNGAGKDTVQLWVNPTLGGSAPLLSDASTTSGNGWIDQPGEFMVRSGTSTAGQVDEINIGNTYANVTGVVLVPEPSAIALLLLGGSLAHGASRRRAV